MADDNGRITNAILGTKLDNLTAAVEANNRRMLECYNDNRANIAANVVRVSTLERRSDVNDEQHKQMTHASNVTTAIGSVTAAIVGIASAIGAAITGR